MALAAVMVGAMIQGAVGFGFSLVAVPTMVFLRPEAVPATLLMLAVPMTGFMAFRGRGSIDARAFAWITTGRVPGTVLGAGLLLVIPEDYLATAFGLLVAAAAVMSFAGPTFEVRAATQLVGGVVSGVMSTVAALGGPPLALVNQKRPGPELRSTLAVSFIVGVVMSLIALAFAGRLDVNHLVLALQLLPGLAVGLWVGGRVSQRLDGRWLRPAVLAFAGAAGVLVVVQSVLG